MDHFNYQRIEKAIGYIAQNFNKQPNLEQMAEAVHMSPYHFQRVFTEWAGVSPKSFLQHFTLANAKKLISNQFPINEVSDRLGLSSTSRLHDLFVKIEAMTPAEFANNGATLVIHYYFYETFFGQVIIASTQKGICYLAFYEDENQVLSQLKSKFYNASFVQKTEPLHNEAVDFINQKNSSNAILLLHLKGTSFQLKVWHALLNIPQGALGTYGQLAHAIGSEKASRAVGTAIGANPIAYVIPCHRVIQSTGHFGGYMWGPDKKATILASEMNTEPTH